MISSNPFDYLSQEEKKTLDSFDKVIVWGYPLHTHTQSYLHACWEKTFKAIGKPTYWFHDKEFQDPASFSYKNCLFIAEGFQDEKIPLESSSTYFVNFCIYPQKYLRCGARLFEIRFNVKEFHDCNNDWKLDDGTHNLVHLSQDTLYESLTSNIGVSPDYRGPKPSPMNYEAIYTTWPTDLLPWEIKFEDAEMPRQNVVHYVGTPYGNKRLDKFLQLLRQHQIEFIHHNPWDKPIGFEEAKQFVQHSILAPDFRPEGTQQDKDEYGELNGKNHIAIGYIPCRLYKNISYGHLPLTDSPHAAAHFGDAVVYNPNIEELFFQGLEAQKDIERKKRAMKMIAERHTYLHRVRDILRAIQQKRPSVLPKESIPFTWSQTTLVTGLFNIHREALDGRNFDDYLQWFLNTLRIPAPMVIFVEPKLVDFINHFREGKPTKIIAQHLSMIPFGWSVAYVQRIQESAEWKAFVKNPKDLTNLSSLYAPLIYSKAAWVWDVIQDNPFQTDEIFWIDAGISRFWVNYNPEENEPHPRFLRSLRKGNKIYAQIGGYKEEILRNAFTQRKLTADELIGKNENILMAGFWGGNVNATKHLCEFVMRFYIQELLQKNRIENEQTALFLHAQDNPHMYCFVPPMFNINYINFLLMATGHILQ